MSNNFDIAKMLKEAAKVQKELSEQTSALENTVFDITSAGGAIKISITGAYSVKDIKIDKALIDPEDPEMLQDAIQIAINEALAKVQEESKKIEAAAMGSLPSF